MYKKVSHKFKIYAFKLFIFKMRLKTNKKLQQRLMLKATTGLTLGIGSILAYYYGFND